MSRILFILVMCCAPAFPQDAGPAYDILTKAYAALNSGDYDSAIAYFVQALPMEPTRTDFRQDLGYTYIRVGDDTSAMNTFAAVMQLDPTNDLAALQFAFLAFEQADNDHISQARATFDQVRQRSADPNLKATAETAFRNVDASLAASIAFYNAAIQLDPTNYVAHQQLANYSEQRGDLPTAAREFKIALETQFASLYLDYARVLGKLGDLDGQRQALQSVAGSEDPYTSEEARDQLAALIANRR